MKKMITMVALILAISIALISCTVPNDPPENSTDDSADSSSAENSAHETGAGGNECTAEVTTIGDITTMGDVTDVVAPPYDEGGVLNYDDMKAMWLSQYDLNNVYSTDGSQRPETAFTVYIKKILQNVKDNGLNTVIVQVRPNADSMYPSEYFPMSSYVVGAYGKEAKYDPFEITVREAHELGLSVQAWFNPLRAMSSANITKVNDRYAIKQWYTDAEKNGKYLVTVNGNVYLNPAYEDVRRLIIDGVVEIVKKYDVDGVHMDDYFYPTTETSFDSAAYAAYRAEGGTKSVIAFRRENLDKLVSGIYSAVKAENKDVIYGISPAGNIKTVYESHCADVYKWCASEGYIDYICPQVYFGLEHQTFDFKTVSKTWQSIIKTNSVKLIIGMTLGKAKSKTDAYAGSGKNEWAEHTDILKRCLEYTETLEKCSGVAYFCYQYFYNPVSGVQEGSTRAERNNFIPVLKEISWK